MSDECLCGKPLSLRIFAQIRDRLLAGGVPQKPPERVRCAASYQVRIMTSTTDAHRCTQIVLLSSLYLCISAPLRLCV
jgi:hypothetical protein